MLSRTFTAAINGLQAVTIEVEVDGNRGIPAFVLIGLPSKAVGEAKERITSTLQNCGIRIKSKRTIVNLAPADMPIHGSSFDLAIAIGLLKMYGEIRVDTDHTMFFGELSLDGSLKRIKGALPLVLAARKAGFQNVVIPAANSAEVEIISGITIYPLSHLKEYLGWVKWAQPLCPLTPKAFTAETTPQPQTDFADIVGQAQAKRALLIAAAGNHNILLTGSPGSGKSLLAKAFQHILPPLTEAEALEVTQIHSILGLTWKGLITARPFRSPHPNISSSGFLGGGKNLKPGEVSLAHRGVLFLDEFLEFGPSILDSLRLPLEEHQVKIIRSEGNFTYPANFTLVAATNPCPCGFKGSQLQQCKCLPHVVDHYQKKLSGPLLDRIDLQVYVPELKTNELSHFANTSIKRSKSGKTANTLSFRQQVITAREMQKDRYQELGILCNSELSSADIPKFCPLDPASQTLLERAGTRHQLSARSYFKVIRIARTIADLAGADNITTDHLAEALQYRIGETAN